LLFTGIFMGSAGQAVVDTIIDGVNYYQKRTYTSLKTEHPPKIDGRLDDDCWSEGLWSGDYTQMNPDENTPPLQQSEMKVLYDYSNIYVAFICHDSAANLIQSKYNSRDVYSGDMIGVAFDSYFDKRTAYEFVMTSAGQKIDIKHIGDYKWDANWNAVWDGASMVSDSGWTAEMSIPLSQLRYINTPEQVWGLHSWRWIGRVNEESNWQLFALNGPSIVDQFGIMEGVRDIKPSRQMEFSPYASLKYTPENSVTTIPNAPYQAFVPGGGIDAKMGLSSNMILDLTINPDFGQVEADPSELNLTSYETFFDEKRPFFLEGRDIFDFNIDKSQMFYSRRIGQSPRYDPALGEDESINYPQQTNILGAAKITGKTRNGLSVGIIESLSAKATATISNPDTIYDQAMGPLTLNSVARIKKEYNDATTIIGGMLTSANGFIQDDHLSDQIYDNAYSGGLDFVQYFNKKVYFVEGKSVFSNVNGSEGSISGLQNQSVHNFQRPDASHLELDSSLRSMTGTGGELRLGKQGGKWRSQAAGSWFSPNLEMNDLGYLRETDMIKEEFMASYVITEPKGILRNYTIMVNQQASWTFGKELMGSAANLYGKLQFKNLWGIVGRVGRVFSVLDPRVLRGGPALATNPYWIFASYVSTNRSKDLRFTLHYEYMTNGSGLYNYSHVDATVMWLPIDRIRLNALVSHHANTEHQQYIEKTTPGTETLYLMGKLDQRILSFTLRAQVFITPELSLEYYGSPYLSIGDYTHFKKVSNPHSQDHASRFYEYAPDEVIYNGAEETYQIDDPDQGTFFMENPDFNFAQFRSNLVFKWEYKLGSILYFVWTHEQTHDENVSSMDQGDNFSNLIGTPARNVFMIKFNYWFTL
jgi:hypothetical protein